MSLPDNQFGSRPPAPEESIDSRLLHLIRQQLLDSGVSVAVEGQQLMTQDRRLAVTVKVREVTAEKVHAHVVSWLPNSAVPQGADPLDACVMGFGPTAAATEQVAEVWLRLVGAPVLSCLSAHVVLHADHFAGKEPWGVPGGHGFVGPFMVRGGEELLDLDWLARSEVFQYDGYPRDGRRHLVKATLHGGQGVWTRYLEIDGHLATYVEEDWRGGPPVPRTPVMCVRFAVFDMIG